MLNITIIIYLSNWFCSDTENQSAGTNEADYYRLLEDVLDINRLPLPLENLLYSLHQKDIHTPAELLLAVVYYIFLESGFVPAALPIELRSKIPMHWGYSFAAQIPDCSWAIVAKEISHEYLQSIQNKNPISPESVYEFKLNLLKYSDDEMQLVIRKIFAGTALCATFCLSSQEQASSIVLFINEFICVSANEKPNFQTIASNPNVYFKNVRKLITDVKQTLIAPLRNVIMYDSVHPNAALHGMPKEILSTLFSYLRSDLQTLQKISQTCIYLRNMAISFLHESNIRLKNRRPTPIIYDPLDQVHHGSRYRVFNDFSGLLFGGYRPLNYYFGRWSISKSDSILTILDK